MKYFVLSLLLVIGVQTSAQDVIYKKDGDRINAKIISIGEEAIKYKKFSNLEGPDYILAIELIAMIKFMDGGHTVFDKKVAKDDTFVAEVKKERVNPYGSNSVSLNYFDLLYTSLSVSYERFSKNGLVSVKIPVGFSFDETLEITGERILYKGGIDINIYPSGQGRVRYFVGPGVKIRRESFPETVGVDQLGNPVKIKTRFSTLGTYVNNGAIFQLNDKINFSLLIAVGIKDSRSSFDSNDSFTDVHGYIEGNFGIRF